MRPTATPRRHLLATVQAHVNLTRDMEFTAQAPNGHTVTLDTASDAGGHALGLEPLDLVLVALGGCMGMSAIAILRKKRQEVTHYEIRLTAQQADGNPHVYREIELDHILAGRDLDYAAIERAIQLAEEKYCPVSAMLRNSVTIINKYRVISDPEHAAM